MKERYKRGIIAGSILLLAGVLTGTFLEGVYDIIFMALILAGGSLLMEAHSGVWYSKKNLTKTKER